MREIITPSADRSSGLSFFGRHFFRLSGHCSLLRLTALLGALILLAGTAVAQTGGDKPAAEASQSPKILLLLDLLEDQDVQAWVKQQRHQTAKHQQQESLESAETAASISVVRRLGQIQTHIYDIVRAIPRLPGELGQVLSRFEQRASGYTPGWVLLLVAGFGALGALAAWIFERLTNGAWRTLDETRPSELSQHLRLIGQHLVLRTGSVVAFALGSVALFAAFGWPAFLEATVVALLLVAVVTWAMWNLLQILFAPGRAGLRIVPVSESEATRLVRLLTLAIAWFAAGYAVIQLIRTLGVDFKVSQVIAYVLGLGLLVIGLRARAGWGYALSFSLMWLLWAISAMKLFWLLAVALFLPLATKYARLSVKQLFQSKAVVSDADVSPDTLATAERQASIWATVIDRAVRATLIFGAIAVLAWGWNLSLTGLADNQDLVSRLARSALSVLAIFLLGDLAWQLIKTMIDSKLANMPELGEPGQAEAVNAAKMRTLLPIVRNAAMVFLLTLTVIMGLSAVGIEIGPLLASAGIVGVAVGFGAQTLVKDVISGMFYLFDDAFRIGEYIVAGSYKGTVESFSLRSVRLRHHRGPIYTIPFGDLGAVQNLSRDFVIDKLSFQVTYDTDLEKARKLIKKAGQELAADSEIGPKIIEPLKMQRVENFGEYGIEIKTKVTCVPGGQWEVRKKLYPMIKQLFEENGIEFARPTVKVSGSGTDNETVAARTVAAKKARAAKAAG
jgi:small-conductance mechanosensitive channel